MNTISKSILTVCQARSDGMLVVSDAQARLIAGVHKVRSMAVRNVAADLGIIVEGIGDLMADSQRYGS